MDTMLVEMLKDAPMAVALLLVFWIFMKHMKEREAAFASRYEELLKESHECQRHSMKAVSEMTQVVSELKGIIASGLNS